MFVCNQNARNEAPQISPTEIICGLQWICLWHTHFCFICCPVTLLKLIWIMDVKLSSNVSPVLFIIFVAWKVDETPWLGAKSCKMSKCSYVFAVLFRCSKGTSRFSAVSAKLSSWEVEAAPVPHVEVASGSDKLLGMSGRRRPPPVKQLVFLASNHWTYLTWWKMWMQMIASDLTEDLLRLWPLGTWKFGSFSTKREMIWSFGDRSLSTILLTWDSGSVGFAWASYVEPGIASCTSAV